MPNAPFRGRPDFNDQAIRDLDHIEDYISRDNPQAARRLLQRLRDACFTLAEQPLMGRARSELGSDIRSFVVPKTRYVIVYRPVEDGVQIIHVRQGSQNINRLFSQ